MERFSNPSAGSLSRLSHLFRAIPSFFPRIVVSSRTNVLTAVGYFLVVAFLFIASAQPVQSACVEGPAGVFTCTGDYSQGIASGTHFSTPPATTLQVDSLVGPIVPSSGTSGIVFQNSQGSRVTIVSGSEDDPVTITTQGNQALGIKASSDGVAAGYEYQPGLGVYVPIGLAGIGGSVSVQSASTISTNGTDAHGVQASNSVGVYHPFSVATLSSFSTSQVDLSLTSVAGNAANIGVGVAGDHGGTFTLAANGTVEFDGGGLGAGLAVGESMVTKLNYQVEMTYMFLGFIPQKQVSDGSIAIRLTKQANGTIEEERAIYFGEFDVFSDPDGDTPLWPDLQGYVDRTLDAMGVSGNGEDVQIVNTGSITTHGAGSHGIYAVTMGGTGTTGQSGTFWDSDQIPDPGGPGANGGNVTIDHNGTIRTEGDKSAGIAVWTQGGTGGKGGDGGPWRFGRQGGIGGRGGDITITGSGSITTFENNATGILALSAGGTGGNGGEGSGVTSGASGGFGGSGGTIDINGAWTIYTKGDQAYGILGKSLGGKAGSGGSGGWLFGNPGNGGTGADGGAVYITSNGQVTTEGDDAYAIYAESVGGFGGGGSFTWGLFWTYFSDAGAGGSGGIASVTNLENGDISTNGTRSHGIIAQSIGGGGGSGEGAIGLFCSLGGEGNAGGNGGTVNVANSGEITTFGNMARGIYAQSVGGGGGDGGLGAGFYSIGGNASRGDTNGDGIVDQNDFGGGGNGGAVTVDNNGTITTYGIQADAVFAESVGGGGGNADTSGGAISTGGDGSAGGNGGTITATNEGTITTHGLRSRGIFAQSVGGGGGNGGGGGGLIFNGGHGAATGDGGEVTVTNRGTIETWQDIAHAIQAQSVGGGGGSGGSTKTYSIGSALSLNIGIGGDGGAGGDGGQVNVFNENTLSTHGANSHAILAQSVGGGGGDGGRSDSFNLLLPVPNPIETPNVQVNISMGGSGEAAGEGGMVDVANTDQITTSGFRSYGVAAQSIGGGGGEGGASTSFNLSINSDTSTRISIGGDGGGGGSGDLAQVDNSGVIRTSGHHAAGILAQSVGGGGGSGGSSTVRNYNFSIPFSPDNLVPGLSSDIGITIGGAAGEGGDGGNATVANRNEIFTSGIFSHGILAQSIGGGGGVGGDVNTVDVSLSLNPTDMMPFVDLMAYSSVVTLSGSGGTGGFGRVVTVDNSGSISTFGAMTYGILAQSIGGGGGSGGTIETFELNNADMNYSGLGYTDYLNNVETVIERGPGGRGNGNAVNVANSGTINSQGSGAHGIVAQSIGGGGGMIGTVNRLGTTSVDFGGAAGLILLEEGLGAAFLGTLGGFGSGGAVTVENTGTIITQGTAAHGIFAQSAGGLSSGAVHVSTNGTIETQGEDSHGVVAQSVGGTISVTVGGGTVRGGTGAGTGVLFMNGWTNTLSNSGTIDAADGLAGYAVRGGGGAETINNSGTITGLIDLEGGTNAFNNQAGGRFNSGATVNLGANNRLTNTGLVSPGDRNTFQTTTLTGEFEQTAEGNLEMEVDAEGNHDQLTVSGGDAQLDGTLTVVKAEGQVYQQGTTYRMVEATAVNGAFATLDIPEDRPLLRFEVIQSADAVDLEVVAPSFATVANNPTDQALAGYFDEIRLSATGDLAIVLSEVQNLTSQQLDLAFASMSPAFFDDLTLVSFDTVKQAMGLLQRRMGLMRLFSSLGDQATAEAQPIMLAMAGGTNEDLAQFLATGRLDEAQGRDGLWVSGNHQWGNQDQDSGFSGYDYQVNAGAIGYDHTFPTKVTLGASVNVATADIDQDHDRGEGAIDAYSGALYGSYFSSEAFVEGVLSYGRNRYKNSRHLTIGSDERTAKSRHDADVFSAHLGGGYLFHWQGLSLGPTGSLEYVYLDESSFTESGADSLNLSVDSRETQSLVSDLGVKAVYLVKTSMGSLVTELGSSLIYDFGIDDRVITASFAGSPDVSFSMDGRDSDGFGWGLEGGFTFMTLLDISLSLKYQGEFRDESWQHGVMGQLRYLF